VKLFSGKRERERERQTKKTTTTQIFCIFGWFATPINRDKRLSIVIIM
jgi:hypothetical protein